MSDPGNYVGSADRSIGQLVASATAEMSALVHDEIALAKAEVRQDVKRGVIGSIAFVVAGVLVLFSIPVLSFAAAYGIHNLGLGLAWSFLIVGGAFIALGGLLAFLGIRKFKKVKPPEKSIASAKQTAAVLQNAKPHPRASVEAAAIIERSGGSGSSLAKKGVESGSGVGSGKDKASAVARSST
ncbi:phage holin family protein [Streptomyces sp. ID03-2B]|uniref:phage holin family protein n=1 Tax=Streptomyces TaxID=1883 RepID=UPI001873A2C8|nr:MULTISPECIES: phage holin family protein [Streptomyces]MCL6291485.1 phage holin family protein [Streptomyces sp. 43Y-GA-1]MDX2669984.1 phage holin family protein [Streptomyces sp. NRRL_ISP-5395]MDX3591392.1 phage holin family protein [Streptomyces sp. ID03-2B]GHF80241.1 transporter [Streptomyces griseus]